jgi:hypothetical protein
VNVHPWELMRAIACLIGGADPAAAPGSAYAADTLAAYESVLGPRSQFDPYRIIFVDSITVASRHCFAWAQRQPDAFSEKTGKPDTRGAYGLMGREMVAGSPSCSTVARMSLSSASSRKRRTTSAGRNMCRRSKARRRAASCLASSIRSSLAACSSSRTAQPVLDFDKGTQRGFICHQQNGYGVPAKDRSGGWMQSKRPTSARC